ncbi:hypothetical protein PG994_012045 [Apiospora phragmitis]|uniref:Carrier domain-containing protein n=1 Tax=Apiospora phragmitis TaxID=2905665 RepID=A0ABR1TWS2_9PEZI
MTVGFGRVAVNESPDLQLQMLDVEDLGMIKHRALAEAFLRFSAAEYLGSKILWCFEPELSMDKSGRQLILRSSLILRPGPRGYIANYMSTWQSSASSMMVETEDLCELRNIFATYKAIRTPLGYKFLVLGKRQLDGASFLTLTPSICSFISVPETSAVPVTIVPGSEEHTITSVAAGLLATLILDPVSSGQSVILHNTTEFTERSFVAQAAAEDISVICLSNSKHTANGSTVSRIKLPEYITKEELSELLPAEPAAYVNFGSGTGKDTSQLDIISCLPNYCKINTAESIFSSNGNHSRPSLAPVLGASLRKATQAAQDFSPTRIHRPQDFPVIKLGDVVNRPSTSSTLAIVDFKDEFCPIEDRISLCDWMVAKGARNIVITSRRPEISPEWIESHKQKCVTVVVIPCDITNEDDLKMAHRQIHESLPPVAGVISGAMVLRDVAIRNMTFEQLVEVTRPKVEGSIHLDRLFYTVDLDFFVLISSVNCVVGSWGQANYAAANMFMCGLVNVGAIIGAGYMERESRRALDSVVQKLHMMRLSEEDWHQAVAEAIDASRLESAHGPEITTGISMVPSDIAIGPTWLTNPKLSAFITDAMSDNIKMEGAETAFSFEDALAQQTCPSRQDLYNFIMRAFATQLRVILQVTLSDEDLMASRSNEIGLDSLVSVDIRLWFLKTTKVNIPTLKIMGNSSMASLVEFAVEAILAHRAPQVATPSDANATTTSVRLQNGNSSVAAHKEGVWARKTPEDEDVCPSQPQPIDWEFESASLASWASISRDTTLKPTLSPPQIIVLTGVTGLFGRHLLEHILRCTSASMIHCLAVRGLARRLHDKELVINDRVAYHAGKLEEPLLGLSEEDSRVIFATADAVIHNGVDTSHIKSYTDMRAANVGSTQTLVGLCLPRGIPFHFVSSAGVALYQGQTGFPEVSLFQASPPASGAFGYGCSKWVSERLLEQATAARFGLREGGPTDGCAALDWVHALLYYVREFEGRAPDPAQPGRPGSGARRNVLRRHVGQFAPARMRAAAASAAVVEQIGTKRDDR